MRIVGGPWPERVGCECEVVTDRLDPNIYPRHGLGKNETIVLIHEDPLRPVQFLGEEWSCVLDRKHIA